MNSEKEKSKLLVDTLIEKLGEELILPIIADLQPRFIEIDEKYD